jgi:hypothetical protein
MNSVQRTILMCGLLVLCFVSIFAPYQKTIFTNDGEVTVAAGRYCIFATPNDDTRIGYTIDMPRVLLQSAAIAAFTAGFVVFASVKKK